MLGILYEESYSATKVSMIWPLSEHMNVQDIEPSALNQFAVLTDEKALLSQS